MSETITVASLRERMLNAVDDAISRLASEAKGENAIYGDCELRACMVLARLAPILIAETRRAKSTPPEPQGPAMQELPPDLPLAEAERLFAILESDSPAADDTNQ